MRAIVRSKTKFVMDQYDSVTNVSYNTSTRNYTISYGNSQTVTYNSDDWVLTLITL